MEFENGTATFTLANGTKVEVRQRRWSSDRSYWSASRVYASNIEDQCPALEEQRAALPQPKTRGEDAENDKAYDAYNRAYIKAWREQVVKAFTALTEFGAPANALDGMRFSRKAGCSCPCSPGGVLKQRVVIGDSPVDFFITLPSKKS